MADRLDVRKAALTLGLVYALYHLSWAVLVLAGGSGFVNWISNIHFISAAFATVSVNITALLVGLVGAFVTGAVTGAIFAYIYNRI